MLSRSTPFSILQIAIRGSFSDILKYIQAADMLPLSDKPELDAVFAYVIITFCFGDDFSKIYSG